MTITFKKEGDVKKKIKTLLTKHGWYHWMPPANGFGKGGISDINAIKGDKGAGQFMAIEAKHSSNRKGTSILQREFLFDIEKNGGLAFVVDDLNIGWFDVFLQGYDNATAAFAHAKNQGKSDTEAFEAGQAHNVAMLNAVAELTKGWMEKAGEVA